MTALHARQRNFTRTLLFLAASCIPNSIATSQTEPASPPLAAFEVATIKPVDPNAGGAMGFYSYPGGTVNLGFANLRMMIYYAFDVPMENVLGGPEWVSKDRYNIVARPPGSSESATAKQAGIKATPSAEQRKMLQSLLIERFNLKCHREMKEGPVYILTRGSGKLHMEEPKDKDTDSRGAVMMKPGGIVDGEAFGQNITMSFLAANLSSYLKRPVLDQTGLIGSYDFHLDPDDPTNTDIPTAVFDAVKRLGLNLKAGKGPIETIVIDSATKPTEN
jgi:uncharacterized protein (TIGR03435 family)